ncbi:hypothetical protein ACOSQ4_032879 [Xanthoceras sorbifolium]
MSTTRKTTLLLLLFITVLLHLAAITAAIGVNYGTLGDNLPPPAQVAEFLRTKTIINRIKLFDANPEILRAFANTNISVTVSVPNGDIPGLVQASTAQNWVAANIAPFYPQTKIIRVAVGNEILHSGVKEWIYNLLPAMKSLHQALVNAGFNIQVSTPHTLGILQHSEPPSWSRFRVGYDKQIISPMLQFLRETKSPLMVNPYPYFGWSPKVSNYALFKPNRGVYDKITYKNMFEASMDAVYTAMKAIGYADVGIVIAETGWPSAGDANQAACSVDNAKSFNGNVVWRVTRRIGTPLMPKKKFETYIFALFNENQKPGATSEKNFGLFKPDFTPVYDIGIMKNGQQSGGRRRRGRRQTPTQPGNNAGGKKWCVAKGEASDQALQGNIDYVCSQGVDCKPIQPGGACYDPSNLRSHASFVMNSYYNVKGHQDSNCNFAQTGYLTTTNPSHGNCNFMLGGFD